MYLIYYRELTHPSISEDPQRGNSDRYTLYINSKILYSSASVLNMKVIIKGTIFMSGGGMGDGTIISIWLFNPFSPIIQLIFTNFLKELAEKKL